MINHPPAKEKGLGCSLFERYAEILNNDTDMILPTGSMLMLTIQYRMVQFFSLLLINYFMFVNNSTIKFVDSHHLSFIMENSTQIHLCYNIFAYSRDFGQQDRNVLLHFVTL